MNLDRVMVGKRASQDDGDGDFHQGRRSLIIFL